MNYAYKSHPEEKTVTVASFNRNRMSSTEYGAFKIMELEREIKRGLREY